MAYVYFDSSYAPLAFLIVPDGGDPYDEGTTQLVQTDLDWPGVASSMGWSLSSVPANDNSGCQHKETDGTVDCPCGATASDFISSAGNYIREHKEEEYPELDEYLHTSDQHLAAAINDWSPDNDMASRAERMGKEALNQLYRDSDGVIRWRTNHRVVPKDIVEKIESHSYGDIMNETPNLRGQRERGFKGMNASLAENLIKTARILCEDEDHTNSDSELQKQVGDPTDSRTSTFVQFRPNPGTMQLPNPMSPVEGDEIFFAYLIPGAIFQANDGTEWWIESYTAPDEIEITNRWYPRINAIVSINDVRRSIRQWVEPVTQEVPPPPPGVDYGALPVKIVDGPERYGNADEITDYKKSDYTGGW